MSFRKPIIVTMFIFLLQIDAGNPQSGKVKSDNGKVKHLLNGKNGPSSSHSILSNGNTRYQKNNSSAQQLSATTAKERSQKCTTHVSITGYLNLLANSIDNFTHGLAVAASFLVGVKVINLIHRNEI